MFELLVNVADCHGDPGQSEAPQSHAAPLTAVLQHADVQQEVIIAKVTESVQALTGAAVVELEDKMKLELSNVQHNVSQLGQILTAFLKQQEVKQQEVLEVKQQEVQLLVGDCSDALSRDVVGQVESELADFKVMMVSHVSGSVQALVGGVAKNLEADSFNKSKYLAALCKRHSLTVDQTISKLNDAWDEKFVGSVSSIQQQVNDFATVMTNFLKQQEATKDIITTAVQ